MIKRPTFFLLLLMAIACNPPSTETETTISYPPADGFDAAGSDSLAIAIADQVMEAQGGYDTWANTHYLQWNFFGSRLWYWDKFTGDLRVEVPKDSVVVLYNLQDSAGQAWEKGSEIIQPDTLQKFFRLAREGWINDAYWLFMPFKLKDSGVTLQYQGMDTLPGGADAHVLGLTFREVGVTPGNKYHVWVDTADYLVRQWAFFPERTDTVPRFVTPWEDYQEYGGLQLSGSRGENYSLTPIAVYDSLDRQLFNEPLPPRWPEILQEK